ncbi:hypothetical protein D8X55_03400 [Malacoplasma penetrans]|uniref:lipoprotein 17-related variable surface protein n=1 Tax=Malacoplasma penetrans TaxID=28227 RepID=UPI001012579B|nr:lipoprotein 17-related variable surface protein [Malacoplasma penetrans]RXY96578.1 hypothetical protein D8X55_03400 [Malacoplasma penetrans]
MKKRNKKLILSFTSAISAIAASLGIVLPASNTDLNSKITSISSTNQATSSSDVIPSEVNDQNANLSTKNGPVTFIGNTITALDWYGNSLWSIDFTKHVPDVNGNKNNGSNSASLSYDGAWPRAWYNWDYNRNTNLIWVLGFWSGNTRKQPLIGINASTGAIVYQHDLDYTGLINSVNVGSAYRFVSALSSGKVMVYGGAGSAYDAKGILYDPTTNTRTLLTGNSANTSILPVGNSEFGNQYRWYFYNLIPIGNNRNLVSVLPYSTQVASNDVGYPNANYDIYFLLVDDQLNMVASSGIWASKVKVASGMVGYRNTQITPQRDYYTMLDGKVVTVVYNTAVIIDGTGSNVTLNSYPMSQSKWIKSWAFDSNQNLYFKFKDEAIIYKVSGTSWNSQSSNGSNSAISPTTYLDLAGINDAKQYANNLTIYNVYGYTGQLMLINSIYNNRVNTTNSSTITVENNPNSYGLAIAVTQNSTQQDQGDFIGFLNGTNSFQKASDFTIDNSVLSSKIPSEITKNDITTLNNSFLKENDSNGFKVTTIDDVNGSITVTCDLYQIPWFSSTLPSDVSPRVITKTFNTTNKINNKVSWKTLSTSTDYDFLNMVPSKVQVADINALDPFQASFQSQTVTNSSGTQLYPKTTYSITSTNDNNGQITIKAVYEYIPMSASLSNLSQSVKTYEATTTYTIFNKSNTTPSFNFMGANSNNSTVDIRNVAQLKNLLSANTLPSSFTSLNTSSSSTNSEFLQFVDTNSSKGYPISKMRFTVTANDTQGTLKIDATMPSEYSPNNTSESFSVTYTNLNKVTSYSFGFNNPTTVGGTNMNLILPSAITDGDIINSFISYTGFSSNDFTITKTANDETGSLTVAISLNSNYASEIGNGNVGFTNYVATRTFTGFMSTDEYNQRFNVEFVDDSSEALIEFKQMQVSQIFNSLNGSSPSLTVGSTTYTNLKDLIENLLVTSMGNAIPKGWKDNSNIDASMYYDDSQGTISFYVKIDQSVVDGSNTDLNLVVNYTGFVKGNVDSTNDNLSFVSDNMLKSYSTSKGFVSGEDFNNFTPTSFANWLQNNNYQYAKELITYKSGQYQTILNSNNNYTFTIIPNEAQRTVSVYIHFEGITNQQSLSEYSVQYSI